MLKVVAVSQNVMLFVANAWRSLRVRLTLVSLVISLFGIWGVVSYVSSAMRFDLERVLGEQQSQFASYVATEVHQEFSARVAALELFAKEIDTQTIGSPAALQSKLQQKQFTSSLFNGGIWISAPDGVVRATNLPVLMGTNYASCEYMVSVLRDATPVISQPITGKVLKDPIFVMVVPVRDAAQKVIGVIAGVTDLGKPNFLDRITQTPYGKNGSFSLIVPSQRLVIAATDKTRSMTALPPRGKAPALDVLMDRGEGSAIWSDADGAEVLTSARTTDTPGWMVAATIPVNDAFASVRQMQQGLLQVAVLITLMASALVWLVIKRQLAPLALAAEDLRQRAGTQARYFPLEVVRPDEVGDLIGRFNQLLADLQQREYELEDAVTTIAVATELQRHTGEIAHVGGWQVFVKGMKVQWTDEMFAITKLAGTTPANLAETVELVEPEARPTFLAAYQALLDDGTEFDLELPLVGTLAQPKWVRLQGFAVMEDGKVVRLYGTLQDISERRKSQMEMRAAIAEKTALLNEVHHRVKNNLQVITSLLRLESTRNGQPATKAVLDAMQGRIRSMALLHESLYRSGTFASTDLGSYLRTLCQQSFRAQAENSGLVRLELDLAMLRVNIDMATPFGLLVNELVSNCLKHGFPDSRSGTVCVALRCVEGDLWSLSVSDNGIGLPSDFDARRETSLGLQLVSDLVKQIGGELTTGSEMGSRFDIRFTYEAVEHP
jgi:two-component sensor histidine kinase/PAS domain-containing protein